MATHGLERAGTICFGCILLGWAVVTLPGFWRTADAERLAVQIVGARSFQPDVVSRAASDAEAAPSFGLCRPTADRAAAILKLYLYEDAVAAKRADRAREQIDPLRSSLRTALQCSPSDAYLWLVLFSIETIADGFKPAQLDYLRMSYQLAPHEGWVALKRNAVALTMYFDLDPALAQAALDEYAELLQNGLYDEAAAIFTNLTPAIQRTVLDRVAETPLPQRERLSKALDGLLPGVPVPGVDRRDDQPWKR
jgi:hypothetical protein